MKRNILVLCVSLIVLFIFATCGDSVSNLLIESKSDSKEVLIRLAGSNGRTILPSAPVFSEFELILQNGDLIETPDASDIDGAGVIVNLSEGTWTITLKGYQIIKEESILAAQGKEILEITSDEESYNVSIELEPIAIEDGVDDGLFSFNITLPTGLASAVLNIDNHSFNLLDNNTDSILLAPGYYDMSIILKKGNQEAGKFEAVHIYSGLESLAELDLSNIKFAEKVYLTGKLGGIRIGTITITDKDGIVIGTKELNDNTAKRSDTWIKDIIGSNIGETIKVNLEFNGEKVTETINVLDAKGHTNINLSLSPASVKYINLADWYSEIKNDASVYFGFNVTANFIRLTYNDGSKYSEFLPDAITETEFNTAQFNQDNSKTVTKLELYIAADRSALNTAIAKANNNKDSVTTSINGKELKSSVLWVTTAEKAAYQSAITAAGLNINDPTETDEQVAAAIQTLANASAAFNNAKKTGAYKVDKTPLEQAIANANAKMAGVTKAANGSTTLNTAFWASSEMFTALESAVANAKAYVNAANNNEDDQSVADAETAALNNAIAAFVPQKGLLIETVFGFSYTFNGPQDETITLDMVNAVISWVNGEKLTVNVAESFDSYQWIVDGKIIAGATGNSITLNARDFSITTHNLTLRVTKNGAPYTKTLIFEVK